MPTTNIWSELTIDFRWFLAVIATVLIVGLWVVVREAYGKR